MMDIEVLDGLEVLNQHSKLYLGWLPEEGRYTRKREFVARRTGFIARLHLNDWSYGKGWTAIGRIMGMDHATILSAMRPENHDYYAEELTARYEEGAKLASELFPILGAQEKDALDDDLAYAHGATMLAICRRHGRGIGQRALLEASRNFDHLYNTNVREAIEDTLNELETNNND